MMEYSTSHFLEKHFDDFSDGLNVSGQFAMFEKYDIDDFVFSPFDVDVSTMIFIEEGSGSLSVNMTDIHYTAPCLLILQPHLVLLLKEGMEMPEKAKGFVMSRSFTDNIFSSPDNVQKLAARLIRNPVIQLRQIKDVEVIYYFFEMCRQAILRKDNPNRIETLRHLILAFFYGFLYAFEEDQEKDRSSRMNDLLDRFRELLRLHFKSEHTTGYYSDQLCVTDKYLSSVIKKITGNTAGFWIDYYLTCEAKTLLASTSMQIQNVCDELNFTSQSSFGKFFKRMTGLSPSSYRKSLVAE